MADNTKDNISRILNQDLKVEKTPVLNKTPNQLVGNVTGFVDGKKQTLIKIKDINPGYKASCPIELSSAGGLVFNFLHRCFSLSGNISEGLIGDVLFGFNSAGIPDSLTIEGLKDLHKKGYIKFRASDNTHISFESKEAESAYIEYQSKFINLFQ